MDGEISAADLHALDDEAVHVVDIRQPASYRRGHIPGSENIPMGALPGHIEELEGAERVVTVCPHGKASVQAARLVASDEGFSGRVESLAPGIEGWREQYDLATDDADDDPDAPF